MPRLGNACKKNRTRTKDKALKMLTFPQFIKQPTMNVKRNNELMEAKEILDFTMPCNKFII